MAKPNYSFEKRRKELAKKQKKEEKRLKKAQGTGEGDGATERPDAPETSTPAPDTGPGGTP